MLKYKTSFIFLISVLLITTNVFAEETGDPERRECIVVSRDEPKALPCGDGGIFGSGDKPGFCKYDIDPSASVTNGKVVIEIFSGGRYGADRHQYLNIDDRMSIAVWVDRQTAPIYITCHDTNGKPASDGSVGWEKQQLLQTHTIASHELPMITPEDEIASNMTEISSILEDIEPGLDGLDTVLDKDEITTVYENKSTSTNDEVLWIGVILIILGSIYSIKEIVNIWRT